MLDEEGQAVLGGAGNLQAVHDTLICVQRLEGCLTALTATMNNGMPNIVFESDSLMLVEALKTNKYDQSLEGPCVKGGAS